MTGLQQRVLTVLAGAGLLVLVFGFGYVLGGRGQFDRGKAVGDAAVAKLTADYASKSVQGAAASRAAQAKADASAIAQAEQKAAHGDAAAKSAHAVASDAQNELARQRAQINNGVRHDATMDAWVAAGLPAAVRGVLDGAED